jgi:hypothetical protein
MANNLIDEVSKYDMCILYNPMSDEVDYSVGEFPIQLAPEKHYIPNNKNTDPFEFAQMFSKRFVDKKVFLLIPGTKFDIYGTRHGRGGGWYDKFLSKIPKRWMRVGVCEEGQFTENKLDANIWDEQIDLLIVKCNNGWKVKNVNHSD